MTARPATTAIVDHPVGIVVIGRNEGERLRRALASVAGRADALVYVDSGSTDDSMATATALGIDVVALSPDRPFTAARARMAGVEHLCRKMPTLAFVQFLDGDCELNANWLAVSVPIMLRTPQAAVICGRRRERDRQASVYNRLCDHEWNTACGEAKACGGDALMRVAALNMVGGFDATLIAGEEPDLCDRLIKAGWRVFRVAREMSVHDAAIFRFSQWWSRNVRSGHASAEALSRRSADRQLWRQATSNMLWALPIAIPLWPALWWRIARSYGGFVAAFIVLGKLPHCQGQLHFWCSSFLKKRTSIIIEYK